MNNRLSLEFGQSFVRIPLATSPHILCGDALETDWAELLPSEECSYVFGNPPFGGSKYQSKEQRAQVRQIAALGKSGGTLDFVSAWFIKAGEYVGGRPIRIGFVATNSITQGEQVAQLWPILFSRCGLEISFAHRTFAWGSDARGKAHVHVVIIGLDPESRVPRARRLFSYDDINGDPHESTHRALSPYLFDASQLNDPHLVVKETLKPLNGFPKCLSGSQPIDGGQYIFGPDERSAFLAVEPGAAKFLRPYIGAKEYLHGHDRWILALQEASPSDLKKLPKIVERMRAVTRFRSASKRKSTLAIAHYPEKYNVEVIPTSPFLVVPEASSQRRDYVPIGMMSPPTIPSNLVRIVPDATLSHFAVLTSSMHMSWLRHIGGRLKSDYRYSIGLVYNTFPMPQATDAQLAKLEPLAQAALDARAAHPSSSLADLYDPDLMPTDLKKAHRALDRAVDKLYRPSGFRSDRERAEHLLGLYESMVAPLTIGSRPKRRRSRKPSASS